MARAAAAFRLVGCRSLAQVNNVSVAYTGLDAAMDDNGHGTAVAAIIAGLRNDVGTVGLMYSGVSVGGPLPEKRSGEGGRAQGCRARDPQIACERASMPSGRAVRLWRPAPRVLHPTGLLSTSRLGAFSPCPGEGPLCSSPPHRPSSPSF